MFYIPVFSLHPLLSFGPVLPIVCQIFITGIILKPMSSVKKSLCLSSFIYSSGHLHSTLLFFYMHLHILFGFLQPRHNQFYHWDDSQILLLLFSRPSSSLKSYCVNLRLLQSLFWSWCLQLLPSSVASASIVIL